MYRLFAFLVLLVGVACKNPNLIDPPPPPNDHCLTPKPDDPNATITVTYRPASPDFQIGLFEEVRDCDGKTVIAFGYQTVGSPDGGKTYRWQFEIHANYPNGSLPHGIRLARLFSATLFDRWVDFGSEDVTLNGVYLTAHSEIAPPPSNCASCKPGVFWYFWVDSAGKVYPTNP